MLCWGGLSLGGAEHQRESDRIIRGIKETTWIAKNPENITLTSTEVWTGTTCTQLIYTRSSSQPPRTWGEGQLQPSEQSPISSITLAVFPVINSTNEVQLLGVNNFRLKEYYVCDSRSLFLCEKNCIVHASTLGQCFAQNRQFQFIQIICAYGPI